MTMTMTIIISNDDLGVGMRFFSLFVFRRESRNKQTFGVKCDLLGQSQIVSTISRGLDSTSQSAFGRIPGGSRRSLECSPIGSRSKPNCNVRPQSKT